MALWLLERVGQDEIWDRADGFVARASTEEEARRLASELAGAEGKDYWLTSASCVPLAVDGPAEVVLRDFTAG